MISRLLDVEDVRAVERSDVLARLEVAQADGAAVTLFFRSLKESNLFRFY